VASRGQTVLSVADPSHVPAGAETVWTVQGGRVGPAGEAPGPASGPTEGVC
jgi:hypothetical protein